MNVVTYHIIKKKIDVVKSNNFPLVYPTLLRSDEPSHIPYST